MANSFYKQDLRWIVLPLGIWLILDLLARLVAESTWFQEVGYSRVLWTQLGTRGAIWAITSAVTAGFLLGNLTLARRLKQQGEDRSDRQRRTQAYPAAGLSMAQLLFLTLGLGLLIGLLLLHYGQIAVDYWQHGQGLRHLDTPSPHLSPFRLRVVRSVVQGLYEQPWQIGLLLAFVVVLAVAPCTVLPLMATVLSLSLGWVLSGQWTKVLQFLHPIPFEKMDPQFHLEVGFYVFSLPILELLEFWLLGVSLYATAAVILYYALGCNSLSQGWCPGFTSNQWRHLTALGSFLLLAFALSYWFNRYKLLYSTRGVAYGASFTDVMVQLPVYTVLSLVALAIAAFLFWKVTFWSKGAWVNSRFHLLGVGLYFVIAIIAGEVFPVAVQRLVVQPNELAREAPYIQRSIASTRAAFDFDEIEIRPFQPEDGLTIADIQQNDQTVRNIRLWDTRPLLETNRQLQQIRLYYKFPDADVDRYRLRTEQGSTEKQQVLIAARELDYAAVPAEAKTWINEHLIYTHGYGFTLSPVNQVGEGGLPYYFVKDIGVEVDGGQERALGTSSEQIRFSIPIGQPRIYYGEITDTYVMTGTRVQELDYPSGSDNVYNTYDGDGGVAMSQLWQRWLFANYLRDWRMLFSQNFTPQTKVLFRRNIQRRVQAIAPFLQYDSDPYLVVAKADFQDPDNPNPTQENKSFLYWIIDAYTSSDRYPYSDPGNNPFNYVRNSVKIVVDAYHGSVYFFVADQTDPLIQSWSQIFPGMFRPLNEMPIALRTHIRYPQDFFRVQSEHLTVYHMTDLQVFYNREDLWRAPTEIYANEPQVIQPYYLIMKLPTGDAEEEFILLRPYTPAQRNNLIAWLAAHSDGQRYGKMLLYQFPKQVLVYGPEQIEARINQDPIISQRISLWNRQGSRALQGNLLVIPLEQSLLYVEPIYLEAEQNSLPTLVRVIVVYEDSIAMAPTLEQAINAIFRPEATETESAPAILRDLEDVLSPLEEDSVLDIFQEDSDIPGVPPSEVNQ